MKPASIIQKQFVALLIGFVLADFAQASMFQETKRKATPDPYFSAQQQKKAEETPSNEFKSEYVASLNLSSTPTASPSRSQPSNQKPVNAVAQQDFAAAVTPSVSRWDPPRTPVVPGKSKVKTSDFPPQNSESFSATENNNDFAAIPSRTPVETPRNKSSIIRELENKSVGDSSSSNDFAGSNSFAPKKLESPAKPQDAPFEKKQPTRELASDKPKSKSPAKKTTPSEEESATENQELFEPTRLLAMVGDEPIFVGDILFDANQRIEQFMPTAPESIKKDSRNKLIKQMLSHFVDSKLMYIDVKNKLPEGANIDDIVEQASKDFDEKAMPKMMSSAGIKSAAQFDGHLRAQGSSLRKMRISWAKDQLTKYFMSQQLKVDEEITHREMLDDYRERKEEYAIPARAKWEQIMVRFDQAGSRSKAKDKIIELRDQIVFGANLAALAKKESHGFRAYDGGQHDWTTKGALVLKDLDEKIFELPIGELSDYFESDDGFHIVRVLERTEASYKSFLEAQVEIKERMIAEKRTEAFKTHLKKLRSEIPVEYFDTDQPASAPVARIGDARNH